MVSWDEDMLSSLVSVSASSDTVSTVVRLIPIPGTGVEFLEAEWELVWDDAGIKSCINPGTLYAHALELRILVPVR